MHSCGDRCPGRDCWRSCYVRANVSARIIVSQCRVGGTFCLYDCFRKSIIVFASFIDVVSVVAAAELDRVFDY